MTSFEVQLILGISGAVILLLFGALGYFLKIIDKTVRQNTMDLGKLKGKIELLQMKNSKDMTHFESTTKKELSTMASNISRLSRNVNILVISLAKNNMLNDDFDKIDLD